MQGEQALKIPRGNGRSGYLKAYIGNLINEGTNEVVNYMALGRCNDVNDRNIAHYWVFFFCYV